MSITKFRAAIIVFVVGFALGASVFLASRLFVRSVLNNDAMLAAEELAADLGIGRSIDTSAALSSVIRYTYFDLNGTVIESASPGIEGEGAQINVPEGLNPSEIVRDGGAFIDESSPLFSFIGTNTSAVKRLVVPVTTDGELVGSLLVVVDQGRALASLTRAFSVIAIVTVGMAVLAVVAVAFVVTRGRGFRQRKNFDPTKVPQDALTGVATRAGLMEILDDVMERAGESDHQVVLMVIDLDRFSAVNGIWGHAIGDKVLQMAAGRLQNIATDTFGVARISGDEFAVIVESSETRSMQELAGRVREVISAPFEVDGASIMLSASIGGALYPINADSGDMLFRAACNALAKAKMQGRNALAVFDTEMKQRMQRHEALERDLRSAIERDEFVVYYQPQVELASGRLRGYEALVRWERPGEGILSPRDFLSVAEETGLILPIGNWVLHKACQDAAEWLEADSVAVNLSSAQFRSQEIDKTIAGVLQETGLAPDRLEIEVPENLFLDGAQDVMDTLNRIKALGVRIAMDDFGCGYAGLASLAQFPFDKIKIDRSFVGQLTQDADVAAIVTSIVSLGRSISVDVTAEGVETKEQVTLLRAAGCSIVQGFRFGAPQRDAAVAANAARAEAENLLAPDVQEPVERTG